MRLKIGELAKRCGLSARTLRHYDQMGDRPNTQQAARGSTGRGTSAGCL